MRISAADVMREFQKYIPHTFEVISESQLDKLTVAKRSNCIINANKLEEAGFKMTHSSEALEKTMKEYVKNI
jgi:hypothetical protein